MYKHLYVHFLRSTVGNESTAGADASVEMPKLHNIKATNSLNIFAFCCANSKSG